MLRFVGSNCWGANLATFLGGIKMKRTEQEQMRELESRILTLQKKQKELKAQEKKLKTLQQQKEKKARNKNLLASGKIFEKYLGHAIQEEDLIELEKICREFYNLESI